MWLPGKHPRVEALWKPKKEKQQPPEKHPNIETVVGTKMKQQQPSAEGNHGGTTITNEGSSTGDNTLSRPTLRNLLAALSFEEDPKSTKTKKAAKLPPSKRKPRLPPIDTRGSAFVHKGTQMGSEVFFDAAEYGDLDKDDFKLKGHPRESVVLADIVVAHRNGSTAVEAVLVGKPRDDISEDEVEYSEHDFIERCDDSGGEGDCDEGETKVRSGESLKNLPTSPSLAPPPPNELPLRFLRAGKNDPTEGLRRYQATLQMRKDERVDTILREASPDFEIIKMHYPHFFHRTGKNGEPCFYEQPPKTNLRALRDAGVTLDKLLRHYTMVTEFQWQYLERDDLATSIYIIDLAGIRMTDFAGEAVDFVKRASAFSAQHYPERAGYVFVINVPGWFKLIWNVIKPIIDEDTLKKISILRGKDEIRTAMQERISLENIPPEYGGKSMPLGESPEEKSMADLIAHNNQLAEQKLSVCAHDCKFCKWVPARSY